VQPLGERASSQPRGSSAGIRAHDTLLELAEQACPWCGGESAVAIGRQPERARRAHARSCPVRGPGGEMPARLPRPQWIDPAVAAAVVASAQAGIDRGARARQLRAQGLLWRQVAAELGLQTAAGAILLARRARSDET
jgi:hypothetical protein